MKLGERRVVTCCKHAVSAARDSKFKLYAQAMATSGCLGACKHSVREGKASSSHSLMIATRTPMPRG